MRWLLPVILLLACGRSALGQALPRGGTGPATLKEQRPVANADGGLPPTYAQASAVPFTQVRIEGSFWSRCLSVNRTVTLPAVLERLEQAHSIANFSCAAGQQEGGFHGPPYADSDVFKWIEGASYALALAPDANLENQLTRVIDAVASAQQADGFLHTFVTLKAPAKAWPKGDVHDTLYCNGHLIEAGVGHFQASGARTLLDVALKNADHLQQAFGPRRNQLKMPPGHSEVELALIRLARLSGRRSYLDLARFLVEQRGRTSGRAGFGEYGQDHRPLTEQREAVGHSVRAFYLYSAVADLLAHTGHEPYRNVLPSLFDDVVARKMFVSGGVGLLRQDKTYESFTRPYDLPNDQPDVDTCSVIGLMFWLQRLNLLEPDGRYFDIFERALYNRCLAGISLDGRRFFYGCPLESRGPGTFEMGPGAECDAAHCRASWFTVPCCPTNLVRFLPTLGGYVYSRSQRAIYVNLFVASTTTIPVQGANVTLVQRTEYPWRGRVNLTISADRPIQFDLMMRIPGWARGDEGCGGLYTSRTAADPIVVTVNDQPLETVELRRNFVRIRRRWSSGDRVVLDLPMAVRRVHADPRVSGNTGRIALQRGPLLYCLEEVDLPSGVFQMSLLPGAALTARWRPDLLGGVMVVEAKAEVRTDQGGRNPPRSRPAALTAVPFFAWDNRRPGAMQVWIPEDVRRAQPAAPQ